MLGDHRLETVLDACSALDQAAEHNDPEQVRSIAHFAGVLLASCDRPSYQDGDHDQLVALLCALLDMCDAMIAHVDGDPWLAQVYATATRNWTRARYDAELHAFGKVTTSVVISRAKALESAVPDKPDKFINPRL